MTNATKPALLEPERLASVMRAIINESPMCGDMAAEHISALTDRIRDLEQRLAEPCQLVHVRCGACGCAIDMHGRCHCEDNRTHGAGLLNQDIVTRQRLEIRELEQRLAAAEQLGKDIDALPGAAVIVVGKETPSSVCFDYGKVLVYGDTLPAALRAAVAKIEGNGNA